VPDPAAVGLGGAAGLGADLGGGVRWGLGKLLAQRLLEAGEHVDRCAPDAGGEGAAAGLDQGVQERPHDALATAIAGLGDCGLRAVRVEDHTAVVRMLIDRYDDLVAVRTQAACRLHVALRELIAGGAPRRVGLAGRRSCCAASIRRVLLGSNASVSPSLVAELRRVDRDIADARRRVGDAVTASATALLELHGVGPIVAGFILGHVGDPARFPTPGRFASYNGTAPTEASSGPPKRHRLNPRGNRKLNHALHLAAVTQVRHNTPGRAYYQRKIAEGKSKKEALRALNRRISDPVWRQLQVDLDRR
jgi:transposase